MSAWALGTVFTVERGDRAVVVTLVEGSVAVGRERARTLRMRPGQELTLMQGGQATLRLPPAGEARRVGIGVLDSQGNIGRVSPSIITHTLVAGLVPMFQLV